MNNRKLWMLSLASLMPALSLAQSAHGTPGCTQENLVSVGGAGLLYCFAAD